MLHRSARVTAHRHGSLRLNRKSNSLLCWASPHHTAPHRRTSFDLPILFVTTIHLYRYGHSMCTPCLLFTIQCTYITYILSSPLSNIHRPILILYFYPNLTFNAPYRLFTTHLLWLLRAFGA